VSWINCSEQLPTHVYSVLGWIAGPEGVTLGEPFADVVIYNAKRKKWQYGSISTGAHDIDVEVSHWQPLPEAPK